MPDKKPQCGPFWSTLSVLFFFLCCLACTKPAEQASVQTNSATDSVAISDVRFYSPAIGRRLWYRIILPTPSGTVHLPVLYLLHGANSDPIEVTGSSEVTNLAVTEHIAVVIPYGEFSYYTNAKHKRNARWEDALTLDLIRDVDTRFPVLTGREHTGIAGISMGGYGAAKLSLKHPDLYGFAGIISGTMDITRRPASLRRCWQTWRIWTIFGLCRSARQDEDVFNLLQSSNQLRQTKWFASCGARDPLHDVNERFVRQVRRRGVELELVTTKSGHDWQSWNTAMPQMFRAAGEALR